MVRINITLADQFGVKVGVHQGSILSLLLLISVLEALSREYRSNLPKEMLHADNLVIITECLEELGNGLVG